jgi:hypothetical protein
MPSSTYRPDERSTSSLELSRLAHSTRRYFLTRGTAGIGAVAFAALLARDGQAAALGPTLGANPVGARPVHRPSRAKNVIYLHMAGSPSQLDLFDWKPTLRRHDGKACPKEFLEGKRFAFIQGVPNLLGSPYTFQRHGACGMELSELLPRLGSVSDRIALVRSLHTDQFNHAPAQLFLHTGSPRLGGASMGSWVTYGLGSENENLPGFVVLVSGSKTPDGGKSLWGSGFLPGVFQGVQCRTTGDPVLYLSNPPGLDRSGRRATLDALRSLNEHQMRTFGDPETVTRISQYELAYRMQIEAPEVMDISREPQHVLDLYGAKPGFVAASDAAPDPRVAYRGDDATFANNCLLARRLVERGVRFVQIYDWGWDHHGSSPGESIDKTLPIKCQQIDRPLAALVVDLEQRGLLDETLIVWGGEFGRTPMKQNNVPNPAGLGRDHHPYAFSMLLAGGGIRGGTTHGTTDELGYYITENPVSVRDLQATILSLLGIDPYRFSYPFQGLDQRLIGPTEEGKICESLFA